MTYFGFLVRFLVVPIIILALLLLRDHLRGRGYPAALRGWQPLGVLGILIGIALVYTTPWDNYLVATGVWWYDPALVTGITLGWVPIEEYTFFILQPILVGLWALWLARRLPVSEPVSITRAQRLGTLAAVGVLWLFSVIILAVQWMPGKYLGLELIWALPPIMLQLGFGLETLVQHRRLVLFTIIPVTVYLAAADALAIGIGIWTIAPGQSLGVMLGGLPVEEAIFFLLTTTLVTLGLVLGIATQSQQTARSLTMRLRRVTD